MTVKQFRLVGYRALADQRLTFSSSFNLITGENASGKTSLIEALDVASRGRSFRAQQLAEISCWHGNGQWAIDIEHHDMLPGETIKLRYIDGSLSARKHDEVLSREQMAKRFPALILGPDLHRLMDDGPKVRRSFMDWALFHVEQSFTGHWRRYQQALRQRNAAIRRSASKSAIQAWNETLLVDGMVISQFRKALVNDLQPLFIELAKQIGLLPEVELVYRQGWAKDLSFEEALSKADVRLDALNATPVGPHRADLDLMSSPGRVQTVLSRGQQKTFLICLAIALATLVQKRSGTWPLLAIDDWQAELSEPTSAAIFKLLCTYQGQRVISGFTAPNLDHSSAKLFHVEQGRFVEC